MSSKNLEEHKKKLVEFWNTDKRYYKMIQDEFDEEYVKEERRAVVSFIKNGIVLDVACGFGGAGTFMPAKTAYVGIDISKQALRMGKRLNKKFNFVSGDVELLPFADSSVDNIICLYSFEHFFKPKEILDEMFRILKPCGRIIIRSPSHDNIFNIPESLKMQLKPKPKRYKYYIKRFIKYFQPGYNPTIIEKPDVLEHEYKSDTDLTNIITIRETKRYFEQNKAMKIIHLKHHKNFYNKGPLKYWNTPLFIVVEKTSEMSKDICD